MATAINMERAALIGRFRERFGAGPRVISRAPGRANIIGEHVDYSADWTRPGRAGNFSLPFALPYKVSVTAAEHPNNMLVAVHSENYGQSFQTFNYGSSKKSVNQWENYVLGVIQVARQKGLFLPGFMMDISGDVPIGSGISSSAAFTVSMNLALNQLFGWNLSKVEIAKLSQAAEHSEFVGTKCGLLDQLASLFARQDGAVLINYADMANPLPIDISSLARQGYKFLLIDSCVSRELGGTYYNDRRTQLEWAGNILASAIDPERPFVSSYEQEELMGLGLENFSRAAARGNGFSDDEARMLFNRAMFVLEERTRTLSFAQAVMRGDIGTCARLIDACGVDLSMNGRFRVSATVLRNEQKQAAGERLYLDILRRAVKNAVRVSDAYLRSTKPFGVRMMGGGGGGCLIALIPEEYDIPEVRSSIAEMYSRDQVELSYVSPGQGIMPFGVKFYEAKPSEGASAEILN